VVPTESANFGYEPFPRSNLPDLGGPNLVARVGPKLVAKLSVAVLKMRNTGGHVPQDGLGGGYGIRTLARLAG
jgi:hypothetical protein